MPAKTLEGDEDLGDLTVDQFKDMVRDIIAQEMGGGEEMGGDMDAGDIEGMGDEPAIDEPVDGMEVEDEEEIDLDMKKENNINEFSIRGISISILLLVSIVLIIFPSEVGDDDTVMMAAIDSGAEDVESSKDGHIIWCIDTNLSEVAAALESDLGESQSTKLIWQPNTTTELDLEGMQKLMKLVDALEDDDDVQRVTTNFEVNDEVMSQISQ